MLKIIVNASFVVISVMFTHILVKHSPKYEKKSRFNYIILFVYTVLCVLLLLKFGLCIRFVKYTFMLQLFIYASVSDIREREVSDWVHFALFITGFIDIDMTTAVIYSVFAFMMFLFMFISAVLSKNRLGGADVKFIAAVTFIMGLNLSTAGVITGMFSAVIFTLGRNRIKKINDKTIPLIPYLSSGFITVFLIGGN